VSFGLQKTLVDCLLRLLLAGVGIECQGRRHVFSIQYFSSSRIFFNDIRHMTYDVISCMILYMIYDMLGWFCFSVSSLSETQKDPLPWPLFHISASCISISQVLMSESVS